MFPLTSPRETQNFQCVEFLGLLGGGDIRAVFI